MVFKSDDAIIITKDHITLRMAINLSKGNLVQFLLDAIEWWSEDVPINEYYVQQLSYKKIRDVINYYAKQFLEITNDINDIQQLVRAMIVFKTRPLPDNRVFMRYAERFRVVFPCIDNEANLVILPSGTNVETMRYDDFVIAEAVIMAKVEAIEREQARHRR